MKNPIGTNIMVLRYPGIISNYELLPVTRFYDNQQRLNRKIKMQENISKKLESIPKSDLNKCHIQLCNWESDTKDISMEYEKYVCSVCEKSIKLWYDDMR